MAEKVHLHDDLDDTGDWQEPVTKVLVGVDGKWRVVYLSKSNRRKLDGALQDFFAVARPATDEDLAEPVSLLDAGDEDEADAEDDEADTDELSEADEDIEEEPPATTAKVAKATPRRATPLKRVARSRPAASSPISDRDLTKEQRTAIHLWFAEQRGGPRKYGPVSRADIREYYEAHGG